jgi:glycosyltransferase involved in cell wall biosynthesis
MKLLQVVPPLRGGAGRLVVSMANALAQVGHQVWLIYPLSTKSLSSDDGITRVISPSVRTVDINLFTRDHDSYWKNLLLLTTLLSTENPDIAHGHTGPTCLAIAVARLIVKGSFSVVGTWHSWSPNRPNWMNDQDSLAYKLMDQVITDSFFNVSVLKEIGIPNPKVIYPVVEAWGPFLHSPDESNLRKRRYLQRNKLVICCIAEVSRRKNQGLIINLVNELKSHNIVVELRIIGPIAENEYLTTLSSAYPNLIAQGQVVFYGHVDDPWELTKECDLFVFPSLSEGLGMAVVEAIARGIPSIFSDREGLRDIKELLTDDCFGVFNPEDLNELTFLVKEFASLAPSLIETKRVRAAKKIRQNFNFHNMITEHLTLYKSSRVANSSLQ